MTLALASAMLLAGCSKGLEDVEGDTLRFTANVPMLTETKATPVTEVTDFYTMGYGATSSQWFPSEGTAPVNVVLSDGTKSYPDYKWRSGENHTFYAYSNNLPSGMTAEIASTGVSLSVTSLPASSSEQTDVLLGVYSGDGSVEETKTGTASLHFYHPFAALQFTVGSIAALSEITNIEVGGLYSQGSTALSTSNTVTGSGSQSIAQFAWQDRGGYLSATQSCSVKAFTSGTEIGEPFMLIPQTFSGDVTLDIMVKMKDGMPRHIAGTLSTGSLVAGKKTVCAISYDGRDVSLSCTIADWGTGQSSTMKVEDSE